MTDLKPVPNPTASVLEQSLALLVSIGGPKERINYLEEAKTVAEHNEKVFSETQAAIDALKAGREAFERDKAKHAQELNEQRQRISDDSLALLNSKQVFNRERELVQNQLNNDRNTLNAKSGELEHQRVDLSAREAKLQGDINQFNVERDRFGQHAAEIQERERKLMQREEQLRKLLNG